MNEIMKHFTSFLQDSDGNNEFKGALDSVVKDIISKDSLYEPMRKLRDEYPAWLEVNWDKVSDEDLERYNQQLDKVTEICCEFEKSEGDQIKDDIFEKLNQLQELGHPPDDLMQKIHPQPVPSEGNNETQK